MRRKPHGIASVSLDGDVAFHSRYPYWHVTGTKGCPFAAADTFDGKIFRVNLRTGEKVLLTSGHRPGSKGALDVRMTTVVSSGFLTTMDQMEVNHCMCWKFPGLRELVDYADVYSLIALRRLQCQNGLQEGCTNFWVPLARHAMGEIQGIYKDLGRPENATLAVHEGGHEILLPALLSILSPNRPL